MKIAVVVGTRPEAIKLAPVIHELERQDGVQPLVISTGQHREMLDQMLEGFQIAPDVDLELMQPDQKLSDLTAALVAGLGDVLRVEEPEWVVVQGDTTSAFSGALAAFYEGIPVAHVEAGLRTGDMRSPFPEEANRKLAGVLTDLHFCPTDRSRANLVAEGIDPMKLRVVGNTVIDALLWALGRVRASAQTLPRTRPRRILLTLHRRENQGEVMRRAAQAVRQLAASADVEVIFPLHKSPAVRRAVLPVLTGVEGVCLCEPLDYFDLVEALDSCDIVLTDSGGLQEEAPTLGKPVLVLRDTTERPEAIEAGVARLVGTRPPDIYRAALELLESELAYRSMTTPVNPFGDGKASSRIVSAICSSVLREAA
jgi:UDP-N-acetylglucosamine 2-epimerase (non-hydrolysing)